MIHRLKLNPGTRTLGELLQEREWAAHEIDRLRTEARRAECKSRPQEYSTSAQPSAEGPVTADAALTSHRFLRLSEACQLVGLSRTSIYSLMGQGRFPASIKIGSRAVRWRMADVLGWQAQVEQRTK